MGRYVGREAGAEEARKWVGEAAGAGNQVRELAGKKPGRGCGRQGEAVGAEERLWVLGEALCVRKTLWVPGQRLWVPGRLRGVVEPAGCNSQGQGEQGGWKTVDESKG